MNHEQHWPGRRCLSCRCCCPDGTSQSPQTVYLKRLHLLLLDYQDSSQTNPVREKKNKLFKVFYAKESNVAGSTIFSPFMPKKQHHRSSFARKIVKVYSEFVCMFIYILCAGEKCSFLCSWGYLHVFRAYLWVIEASRVRIRGVSVLRRSHLHICWCSASLLQGLAGIGDLTGSYRDTNKIDEFHFSIDIRISHCRGLQEAWKRDCLPFCDPVLSVVSGAISAC